MSHRSGISASPSLKAAFSENKGETNVFYLKIVIEKEAFVLSKLGEKKEGTSNSDIFSQMAGDLEDRVACYIIFRDPLNEGKWSLCQYMPDLAMVNMKMLYAASRSSLKEGFGLAALTADFFITEKSEMTFESFSKDREEVGEESVLTYAEQAKNEAKRVEILAQSDGVQLTVSDVPIKVTEGATEALNAVKSKSSNVAVLYLDTKSQDLFADQDNSSKDATVEDICKICTKQQEPRYVLYRYAHQSPTGESKEALLFFYYCPDEAIPRQKMMYSTCKAMVLRVLEKMDIKVTNKMEASTAQELTESVVMDELYPKTAEKITFNKPKTKGKRRLISKKKFKA